MGRLLRRWSPYVSEAVHVMTEIFQLLFLAAQPLTNTRLACRLQADGSFLRAAASALPFALLPATFSKVLAVATVPKKHTRTIQTHLDLHSLHSLHSIQQPVNRNVSVLFRARIGQFHGKGLGHLFPVKDDPGQNQRCNPISVHPLSQSQLYKGRLLHQHLLLH